MTAKGAKHLKAQRGVKAVVVHLATANDTLNCIQTSWTETGALLARAESRFQLRSLPCPMFLCVSGRKCIP